MIIVYYDYCKLLLLFGQDIPLTDLGGHSALLSSFWPFSPFSDARLGCGLQFDPLPIPVKPPFLRLLHSQFRPIHLLSTPYGVRSNNPKNIIQPSPATFGLNSLSNLHLFFCPPDIRTHAVHTPTPGFHRESLQTVLAIQL